MMKTNKQYTLVWCINEADRTMTFKSFISYAALVRFVIKDIGEDPIHIEAVDSAKSLFYLNI